MSSEPGNAAAQASSRLCAAISKRDCPLPCKEPSLPPHGAFESVSEHSPPLSIPEQMTLETVCEARSWPLMERFCRERGHVPEEEGRRVLHRAGAPLTLRKAAEDNEDNEREHIALAAALSALFESCPGLLREEEDLLSLLRCFILLDSDKAREFLTPWLMKRPDGSPAALNFWNWIHTDCTALILHWRSEIPGASILAIDRWSTGFSRLFSRSGPETRSHIFDVWPISGEGRSGELSPLAHAVLESCGIPLIESLLQQPAGLLATEDPGALIDFVMQNDLPRAVRACVLAHVQKEEAYEL